ncbi:MAG: ankyrin repeat domain-containing protein, partial [Planctomycetes bacterium]|nr:ankyrin repeat domain-containing protein [Planctomycetota bacterium]
MQNFRILFLLLLLVGGLGVPRSLPQSKPDAQVSISDTDEWAWSKALNTEDLEAVRALAAQHPSLITRLGMTRNYNIGTPLHFAVERDMHDLAALLLELGADVSARNRSRQYPIHLVRSAAMVSRLIEAGADPLVLDGDGLNAIQSLDLHSKDLLRVVVDRLMQAGVPLDLNTAVRLGWTDAVQLLIDGGRCKIGDAEVLYAAVYSGEVEILKVLLESGWSVDCEAPEEDILNYMPPSSPLEAAVWGAEWDAAALLLEAGADREAALKMAGWESIRGKFLQRAEGGDLLDRAIDAGHPGFVRALLARGFDPDLGKAPDYDVHLHETRLVRAAWRGNLDIVSQLVEAGAELNRLSHGASPLLAAAAAGHRDVYDLLRQKGAKVDLHAAAAMGVLADLRLWMETPGHGLDGLDLRCRRSALAWSVHCGHEQVAIWLLRAGADPNVPFPEVNPRQVDTGYWASGRATLLPQSNSDPRYEESVPKRSVLSLAIQCRQRNVITELQKLGVPVGEHALAQLCVCGEDWALVMLDQALLNTERFKGNPYWAIPSIRALLDPYGLGWPRVRNPLTDEEALIRLERILHAGVGKKLVDELRNSVLKSDMRWETRPDLARRLVELGAPVDLGLAVELGLEDLVRKLDTAKPADPAQRGMLMFKAVKKDDVAVAIALLDGAPEGQVPDLLKLVSEACYAGSMQFLTEMVDRGVITWQHVFSDGETLLNRAAAAGPEAVDALLSHGLSVDQRDHGGGTALHTATRSGDASDRSVELLIKAGADVNARDCNGNSPLVLVLRREWGKKAGAARLLLEAGSDPLSCGRNGMSAYDFALR